MKLQIQSIIPRAPIIWMDRLIGTVSFPPRRFIPLRDTGESRRVAASTTTTTRPYAPHLDVVARPFLMNSLCSSGVALLYGVGRSFLTENPSRCASRMADLLLYCTPNRSSMCLASILAFQLPRTKPHLRGVPSRSPSMVRSCSGLSSRGLPGLLVSCQPSGHLRSILYSHR